MQTALLQVHSILRWVILVLLLLSVFKAFSGWKSKKAFSPADKKVWLFTLIASHINLLIGLYQTFLGRMGMFTTSLPEGTSVMKDANFRFYWVEHPVMMIGAVVAITIAYGKAKKPIEDNEKYKKAFIVFTIALLLVLAAIPWPFRAIVGRPL